MKGVTRLFRRLLAGANVATIVLMLFVAYSDRIDPEAHPLLACAGMIFPVVLLLNLLFFCVWLVVRWRMVWLPLVGFALAYIPITIYMPLRIVADPPQGDDVLKVLSYNVHGYSGMEYGHDTFDTIFVYMRQHDADLLCVQEENDTWRHCDTAFSHLYPYNDTVHINQTGRMLNVVALHSRLPILRHERIATTSATEVNGAVAFYVQRGDDTMLVVNCHLENVHLNSEDRDVYKSILKGEVGQDTARAEGLQLIDKLAGAFRVRARQAKDIHHYVATHHAPGGVIVCGDFNDTPISYVRHTLSEGLTDCYQAAGCGVGLSYNQKGFNFRIDHFLCSSELQPVRCEIDTKFGVSDHYPLICWLKMGDNP